MQVRRLVWMAWHTITLAVCPLVVEDLSAAPGRGVPVCVAASERLTLDDRELRLALAEAAAIWEPAGVALRPGRTADDGCERLVMLRADVEATALEQSHDAALGWVPFAEGRTRWVVFLRLDRIRMLTATLSPGPKPEGLTRLFFTKLLGRTLAHELGHVLMNSRRHETAGLMRQRLNASDVLRESVRAYTLTSAERVQLITQLSGSARRAAR